MFLVRENTKLCLLYAISGMLVVMIQIPGTACMVWYVNFTSSFILYCHFYIYIYICNHTGWIEVSPYTTFVMLYNLINFDWMRILTNLLLYYFSFLSFFFLFLVILYAWQILSRLEIIAISFIKFLNFKFLHKKEFNGWLAWNLLFMLCNSNSENFNILII